jgi:hypothetical protein
MEMGPLVKTVSAPIQEFTNAKKGDFRGVDEGAVRAEGSPAIGLWLAFSGQVKGTAQGGPMGPND